jgi:hypothetical protein
MLLLFIKTVVKQFVIIYRLRDLTVVFKLENKSDVELAVNCCYLIS